MITIKIEPEHQEEKDQTLLCQMMDFTKWIIINLKEEGLLQDLNRPITVETIKRHFLIKFQSNGNIIKEETLKVIWVNINLLAYLAVANNLKAASNTKAINNINKHPLFNNINRKALDNLIN